MQIPSESPTKKFPSKIINHCTSKITAFHETLQRADESQEVELVQLDSSSEFESDQASDSSIVSDDVSNSDDEFQ